MRFFLGVKVFCAISTARSSASVSPSLYFCNSSTIIVGMGQYGFSASSAEIACRTNSTGEVKSCGTGFSLID